jgi:hypothetical protein
MLFRRYEDEGTLNCQGGFENKGKQQFRGEGLVDVQSWMSVVHIQLIIDDVVRR